MAIERVFLGWDRPCLHEAADRLLSGCGAAGGDALEMSDWAVVLPGRRAGRRLEELLAEGAERVEKRLVPPRIVSPGGLVEMLLADDQPVAGEVERRLAWAAALRAAEGAELDRLAPYPPRADDPLGWDALAERLDRMNTELSGGGLDFEAVARRCERMPDFADAERWRAMASIRGAYLRRLEEIGLADPRRALWDALEAGRPAEAPERIVLVGAVDLNELQRRAVGLLAERAGAWVHAPEDRAEGFDDLGCLRPAWWSGAGIEIEAHQVVSADRPADQAAASASVIGGYGGRFAAEEITIGVCDPGVAVELERELGRRGAGVRDAAGLAVGRTRPARLLAAAADWLERRRFEDFATLIRHPDIERRLLDQSGARGFGEEGSGKARARRRAAEAGVEDWLTLMDRYYQDHLPGRLGEGWLGDPKRWEKLKGVHDAVAGLMGELTGPPRPIEQWAAPIADVLIEVYGGRPLDRGDAAERAVLGACERLHAVLSEMHELSGGSPVSVNGSTALRLLLRHAAGREPIPPEPLDAAIELLGPLELAMDDAPALIVTGFNEGFMPASITGDAFLPDGLRRRLGLVDNAQRYARDAYALSAVLARRAEVKLIAGRRNAEGDPLAPSRLLFACEDRTLAERMERLLGEPPFQAAWEGAEPSPAGAGEGAIEIPRPEPPAEPITRLSVTRFRDYIACPYRFYLRHVRGLRAIDDRGADLDGGAFGDLAHRVLAGFGEGEARDAADAGAIRADLERRLEAGVRERYGDSPPAAVRVQAAQLRRRLGAFAEWQAGRAAEGWRIRHVELSIEPSDAAPFLVDGEPFYLYGRIDRIDEHEGTGERVIFDYKTGDSGHPPKKTHRKGEAWVDLQLPLYRHLARHAGVGEAASLGYIVLPKDTSRTAAEMAAWDEGELAEADEAAREVVRGLRAERFWPPVAPPPRYFDELAPICQEGRLIEAERAAAAGEERI